jgi:predicted permease
MNNFLTDIAYALRLLRRRPGFTASAILTLALGVGTNVAIFSALRAVLIENLPYPDAGQLVHVSLRTDRSPTGGQVPNIPAFEFLRTNSPALKLMAVTHEEAGSLSGFGPAEPIRASAISVAMMDAIGLRPVAGRGLAADDFTGISDAMLISERLWTSRFGRDEQAIGRLIRFNGSPRTIVGVMPDAFDLGGLRWNTRSDAWIPLIWQDGRGSISSTIIARLPPGYDVARATREVDPLIPQLPDSGARALGIALEPYAQRLGTYVRPGLLLLQAAAALLLLIACTNLGNLLLTNISSRRREIGVRVAIGGSRARLVRQMLTEAGVLGGIGAGIGVLLAYLTVPALAQMADWVLPRARDVAVRLPELAAGLSLGLGAALLAGTIPALNASRQDAITGLRSSAGLTPSRAAVAFRSTLVTTEVLLAVMLLATAGLLINSFARAALLPMGFETRGLVVADVPLTPEYQSPDRFALLLRSLGDELSGRLHGAQWTFGTSMPYSNRYMGPAVPLGPDGRYARLVHAPYADVAPNYFEILGIPLVRGRPFGPGDIQGSEPVVIVSELFAREYGPPGEIVGANIRLGPRNVTVIGVVGDTRHSDITRPPEPTVYSPFAQRPPRPFTIAVRGASVSAVRTALREAFSRIDSELFADRIELIDSRVRRALAERRFYVLILTLFAGLGVALASVGVFGVTAHAVGLRSREFGVRLALGSSPSRLNRLVVRQGLTPVAIGLTGGLVGAWWTMKYLQTVPIFSNQLYQITAHDPATLIATGLSLLVVAVVACWVPARRAARVDPVGVLRAE